MCRFFCCNSEFKQAAHGSAHAMQEYLRNFVHIVVVVIGLGGFQISCVARYH